MALGQQATWLPSEPLACPVDTARVLGTPRISYYELFNQAKFFYPYHKVLACNTQPEPY